MARNITYEIHLRSLSDQVYRYVKHLILSGKIRGGERIPEKGIAEQFGVSRTPVREALRRLEEYGLIQFKPRSYAMVASLKLEEAEQLSIIRAQIETLSVGLLTEYGKEEDFKELDLMAQECNSLIASGDIATTFEKDSLLHLEISRRTGNSHLYDIFEKLDAKIQLLRLVLDVPLGKLKLYVKQHDGIISAMQRRDKELAVSLMKCHIMNQMDDLG